MRRLVVVMVMALAAAILAGCGGSTTVDEGPVTVARSGTGADNPGSSGSMPDTPGGGHAVRIAVVTHGQASSPFWAIVRNGVEAAGRQMDVVIDYKAPDVYSLAHMEELIDQAVATRPDGLVVSLPEPGLAPAIERAVKAGIPTVTINSGSDQYKKLGVLAHVGQPEGDAGFKAGRRLARAGVHRALCINLLIPNQGLDARCAGLARAMRAAGGTSKMVRIDDQAADAPRRIAAAVEAAGADGALAMNGTSGLAAGKALAGADVTVGTFDLGPDVLKAVRDGRLAFAVDQQAYLQGYLPVVLLAQKARYGLFPAQGDVIPTGPNFVTAANAAQAIELSARSIR
ncbi:MAG TPA: substrate-binding domain-containing protein [Baekduia sp.]|uniref:substrate-binding domain-containing protein n=1 Tax=Baekduia sp. TaxID=2600305 RepID=UPI002D79919C|nr:substrate-binding domain-containing protein [Baekduia sp.]HET6507569.1 substrate-binding domain-containing protein [Baekduia sp.]